MAFLPSMIIWYASSNERSSSALLSSNLGVAANSGQCPEQDALAAWLGGRQLLASCWQSDQLLWTKGNV